MPCEAYHKSDGVIDEIFVESVGRLIAKHCNDYERILSTCLDLKTNPISFQLYKAGVKIHLLTRRIQESMDRVPSRK